MKKLIQALVILTISLFIGNACNKPSTIGSDLLPDEDFVELLYTENIALRTSTVRGDSALTYTPTLSSQLSNYLCGRLDDPICGESTANFSAQFGIISKPTFNEPTLDSVVLLLGYADEGHVGELRDPQSFEVHRINEDLFVTEDYYSTQMFATSEKIGESVPTIPTLSGTSVKVPYIDVSGNVQYRDSLFSPHLRITLDSAFGDSLLAFVGDPDFVGLTDEFTQFLKGLTVIPKSDNSAMLNLTLNTISEIRLYYSEPDDDTIDPRPKELLFPIRSTSVKTSGFQHDYDLSEVESFLDNTVSYPEDFTFIQSMEGLFTKVEFPGLADFEDIAVNQAELIFTVVRNTDLDTYPAPQYLGAIQKNESGNYYETRDFQYAGNTNNISYFGGTQTFAVRGDDKIIQYRMYITSFLQGVIDNRYSENALYLLPLDTAEQATRVVLGGSNHNNYPVQLRLTYTKL